MARRGDGKGGNALPTAEARLNLANDRDDAAADRRDAFADERDQVAGMRDTHADVRDAAISDQPDPAGTRRFAAQDRKASAENREASADDRHRARDDRQASRWTLSVAEQLRVKLLVALKDSANMPEATLLIGEAQAMLVNNFGGDAGEALIEIGDRSERDSIGLQEAAHRILDDGAPSGIYAIPRWAV
jgi:hypothetical protein